MNAFLFIVLVLLFVALTPNILLSLPPKASKLTVAFTHGLVFAVVWTLIHKPIWRFGESLGMRMEGMTGTETKCTTDKDCNDGKKCTDQKCA
jgi:hypothetical protein